MCGTLNGFTTLNSPSFYLYFLTLGILQRHLQVRLPALMPPLHPPRHRLSPLLLQLLCPRPSNLCFRSHPTRLPHPRDPGLRRVQQPHLYHHLQPYQAMQGFQILQPPPSSRSSPLLRVTPPRFHYPLSYLPPFHSTPLRHSPIQFIDLRNPIRTALHLIKARQFKNKFRLRTCCDLIVQLKEIPDISMPKVLRGGHFTNKRRSYNRMPALSRAKATVCRSRYDKRC